LFATLAAGLGAVAQSGSAPRSHRGGQGFKSPQLHPEIFTFDLALSSRLALTVCLPVAVGFEVAAGGAGCWLSGLFCLARPMLELRGWL
jgi:hypothetical protein